MSLTPEEEGRIPEAPTKEEQDGKRPPALPIMKGDLKRSNLGSVTSYSDTLGKLLLSVLLYLVVNQ